MNPTDDDDREPIVFESEEEPLFRNAPTLHFNLNNPIALEDIKRAIERGTKPRPQIRHH